MPGQASLGHHPGFRAGVLPPAGQLNAICCDGCSEETEACTRDCAGPGDVSSLAGRGQLPAGAWWRLQAGKDTPAGAPGPGSETGTWAVLAAAGDGELGRGPAVGHSQTEEAPPRPPHGRSAT